MIPTKSSKTKQLTPITFLFLFIFVWFQLPDIIVIISGRSSCSYNSPFSGRKTYSFRACASFEIGQILPIPQVCQRVVNPVVRAVTASCSLSWSQFSFIFLCVLCVLCGENCGENYGETNPNKWGLTIVYICRYFAADKWTADEEKKFYDCPHAPDDRYSMGRRFPERLTKNSRHRRSGSDCHSERES